MIYEYECIVGHVNSIVSRCSDKPDIIACRCGRLAEQIISLSNVFSVFGNGKSVGDHIAYDNREFKNYRDMEKYCNKEGLEPYTLSKSQVKQRQEERRHKRLKPSLSSNFKPLDFKVSNDCSNKLEKLKKDTRDRTKEAKDIIRQELS